jgi:ABC-2 type transport system ATP-binding protein
LNVSLPTGFDGVTIALLIPVVLVQLALMGLAAADLLREDRRVRGGSKPMWALIIVFVNLIGPVLYLLIGRDESAPSDDGRTGGMPGWGSPHDPRPAAAAAHLDVAPAGPPVLAGLPAQGQRAPLPDVPPAIIVDGLVRRYPGGVVALDGLSLQVPAGSVFGLLGPNGAGKTTCLRLLAGLTRATAGHVLVAGSDPAVTPLAVRSRLGYLEQDPRAYGWMTGREQLRLVGRLHGLAGLPLERAIADVLDRVDLRGAADRRTGGYSGGMRQRLGIAGALVHRPPVVILDEPVSALDPEGRRDVLGLIAALRGETTVLFSSHVLGDVERICDRVAILDRGRLVVEGALEDLIERYAGQVWRIEAEPGEDVALAGLATTLRGFAWVTAASAEHGVLTVAVSDHGLAARELLPAIAAAKVPVVAVLRDRPTLEDVFLRLTGESSSSGVAA